MFESGTTDVVLQATSTISLKKAPKLAKFNNVLDQMLAHIQSFDTPAGNAFLETEGVLRLSGTHSEIASVFEQMLGKPPADLSGDPSSIPLSNFKSFIQNPHNVIGLLKRMLKEKEYDIPWSNEARDEFEKFRQSNQGKDTKMSFEILVNNLINRKLYEEAKAVHNLLHLCYKVSSNSSVNKMPASNVAIAIGPSIGPFFDLATDPQSAQLLEQMGQHFRHPVSQHVGGGAQFIKAVEHDANKPGYFSKPFSAANPDIAAQMAKQYEDNKKYPPIVKPVVFLGIKLPLWISKIIRALAPKPTKEMATIEPPKKAAVADLPIQAKAQEERSTPAVASAQPAQPAQTAAVSKEIKVEPTPAKKHHTKRKDALSPHRKAQRKDLDKGLKEFPFEARKAAITEKLQDNDTKKSHYKKKPKRST